MAEIKETKNIDGPKFVNLSMAAVSPHFKRSMDSALRSVWSVASSICIQHSKNRMAMGVVVPPLSWNGVCGVS